MENKIYAEFVGVIARELAKWPNWRHSPWAQGYIEGLNKAADLLNESIKTVKDEHDKKEQ